jgi:cbb3-type cytochrome oxidase subunit 1
MILKMKLWTTGDIESMKLTMKGRRRKVRRRKVMRIWIVVRCFYDVNQTKISTAAILA